MREKKLLQRFLILGVFLGISLSGIHFGSSQKLLPYKNPELSLEDRVNDLLARLTTKEKAHQLASFFPNANVRLGIPHMQEGEALHGICLPRATSYTS